MCAHERAKVPFAYRNKDDFPTKLAAWIGHVFYDILPKNGFEIREDQIYTAYQLANAVCKQKVHFAEAGLGTGKTFAYLLTAIPYARLTGKPVLIACASTALQEQLTGPKGDIHTLSRLLDLDIDAKMAKDSRQFICDDKVSRINSLLNNKSDTALNDVYRWAENTHLGERSEMPHVPDRIWKQVAWDETVPCENCESRGFCKLVKAREDYRTARDLIVGDHEIFFDDLWTRDERMDDGVRTLLPDYAAVIIDEGHKIILPAAMRAGRQIVKEDMESILLLLEQTQGARASLLAAALTMQRATSRFFKTLQQSLMEDERTNRIAVRTSDELFKLANTLRETLESFHDELQNEQELHTDSLSPTRVQVYEGRIERAIAALNRFDGGGNKDAIFWVDRRDGSFWVVPRDLSGMLEKNLFGKRLPVVFSSATLSTGGDFSYFTRILGLKEPSSSSVDSSFELGKQVLVYLPQTFSSGDQQSWFSLALKHLVSLLQLSKGRALVLTNAPSELQEIRRGLKEYKFPFEVLWEDSAERGYLVQRFREDVSSVLVGSGFWEGIDVPGEALSLLVIWRLPFPPHDPLIEARRHMAQEQGLDPLTAVDYPEMGLRLKQGCGRLIRKGSDRGVIAVMDPVMGMAWEEIVRAALPSGAAVVRNQQPLSVFLNK